MMYYKQFQWNSFTDIIIEEQNKYQNFKKIHYIFNELINLEKEYADGLLRLDGCFNFLNTIGILGTSLSKLSESLKKKRDCHLHFASEIKNLIKNEEVDEFYRNHKNLHSKYEIEENKFRDCALKVENAKNKYHKCFSECEKKLRNIPQNKNEPFDQSMFNNDKKTFIEEEKSIKLEYCEAINEGNEQKNNYVNAINRIFDDCEEMDMVVISKIVNCIKLFCEKENEVLQDVMKLNTEINDNCNLLDEKKEIELFCEKNHRHGCPPTNFDFVVYNQDYFYPPLIDVHKSNISGKLIKQFFKPYRYFPPQGINDPSLIQKYNDVETFAINSWLKGLGLNELKQLENLFDNRELRIYFLNCANHFRVELFPLSNEAFNTIVHLMKTILSKSIEGDNLDYEAIKFIIILSQTFYKDKPETNESQYLVQNEILSEPIWKRRDIWEGLIDFSYNLDMSENRNSRNLILQDKVENRIFKEQTTMTIILVTYKFIMKCFIYDSVQMCDILKTYCSKFKLNKDLILSNDEELELTNTEIVNEMNIPQVANFNIQQIIDQTNENTSKQSQNKVTEETMN